MTDDDKALCEALGSMWSHRGDGIPTQYVNPDGHAAATRIRELSAELDTVRTLARDMATALNASWDDDGMCDAHIATLTRWQEHEGGQP